MILQDLHTHTTYCDGKNSPEEMVQAAILKGMYRLGFSGHCYTYMDGSYCMSQEDTVKYKEEITALKEKYKDQIQILLGIEQDYLSLEPVDGYDYVIGSSHYVKTGEGITDYVEVDSGKDSQKEGVEKYFGGDYYAFAEAYFAQMADVVNRTDCDIIGHFDLLSKFNQDESLYDPSHPRYVKAWKSAADALLKTGRLFEINTGVIYRGYRTAPYPAPEIIEYIRERGGKFILSGDCHNKDALCYHFEDYEDLVTELPEKFGK